MEWSYLLIFILAIMVPNLIDREMLGMSQGGAQSMAIFILGLIGLAFFMLKKHQLKLQYKEKEREKRRLQQTAKDLVESYSYIGEINRKMDMLMQVGVGLLNSTNINKQRENELYKSILEAGSYLLKGKSSLLIFFNTKENKIKKEICLDNRCKDFNRSLSFLKMDENVYIKYEDDYMVICSQKVINNMRSYLVIRDYDRFQGSDNNNQEILKYLVSQALFLFSSSGKIHSS